MSQLFPAMGARSEILSLCPRCGCYDEQWEGLLPCGRCYDEMSEHYEADEDYAFAGDEDWTCISCNQPHEGQSPLCNPCYRQAVELHRRGYSPLKMAMNKERIANGIKYALITKNNPLKKDKK